MKCILTSVNYADYLDLVASYNHKLFDEVIVVTIESDVDTIKVCNKYKNYTCITAPNHAPKYNPEKNVTSVFNKGHLLNYGFKYLESIKYKGYICCTDGDVAFSPGFINCLNRWKRKLKSEAPDIDQKKMIFGAPRYMIEDVDSFHAFMKKPDTTCVQEKGRWRGTNYPIMRLFNESKERVLLGYCQIYYIDTELKLPARIEHTQPYYMQYENSTNTMIVDTKLIGNFLATTTRQNIVEIETVAKVGKIIHASGKDTIQPGFNFEGLIYKKQNNMHLYGCHIEDPNFFCSHIGKHGINKDGRVSEKLT